MKAAAALLLLAVPSACAFLAPLAQGPRATRSRGVARMAFESEVGVTGPLGYWDPLGFSSDGDIETFNRYRAVEIKHGRIAQLAVLHYIVTYFVRLPGSLGDVSIADIPSGLKAIQAVPPAGWAQVLLFASALEILAPQKPDKIPGDVQPDTPLFPKLDGKSADEASEIQNKELNNGRLAQVAILGIWVGELLTGGQHPIDTLLSKLSG